MPFDPPAGVPFATATSDSARDRGETPLEAARQSVLAYLDATVGLRGEVVTSGGGHDVRRSDLRLLAEARQSERPLTVDDAEYLRHLDDAARQSLAGIPSIAAKGRQRLRDIIDKHDGNPYAALSDSPERS